MSIRGHREGTNGLALSDEQPLAYLARWVLRWRVLSTDARRTGSDVSSREWAAEMAERWRQLAVTHVRQHHAEIISTREGREILKILDATEGSKSVDDGEST